MPFIAPELIIQAKQMDLLTYLKNYEPYELVKFSGNTYCTRTHDSLKISNGKWIWWSRGIGGRSALDYLIKVKGYSFLEAVETIIGHTAIQAPVYEKPQPKEENKPLLLPEKCASNRVITEYLFGRGIDFEIINYCISNDLIFESLTVSQCCVRRSMMRRKNRNMQPTVPRISVGLWAIAVAVKKIILFGLVRKTWRKYTSLSVP